MITNINEGKSNENPWGGEPTTESGDWVYGLENLHGLRTPVNKKECEEKGI